MEGNLPIIVEEKLYKDKISEQKGVGLRAKVDIEEGELILNEEPLLHVQAITNKEVVKACSECTAFISPLTAQLNLLLDKSDEVQELPLEKECGIKLRDPCLCSKCGETYCSPKCLEHAQRHHSLLCCKSEKFEKHAEESKIDIFLLAARAYAVIVNSVISGNDFETAWKPFSEFSSTSLTTLLSPWIGLEQVTVEITKSFELLKEIFTEYTAMEQLSSVFTLEFYDKLLGMLQLNVSQMKIRNPLEVYFNKLQEIVTEVRNPSTLHAVSKLVPLVDKVNAKHGCFPFSVGIGIFSTHHFLNHSCDPNAMNGIMGDAVVEDARVTVWALRKIAKGEEVEISYIDNSMPLQMRRTELKNLYLFDCNCERCVREEEFDTPPPYHS